MAADSHNQQWLAAVGGGSRWQLMADGGGRQRRTVVKVNEEIINWCEVRRVVMRKYKIKGEKIEMK